MKRIGGLVLLACVAWNGGCGDDGGGKKPVDADAGAGDAGAGGDGDGDGDGGGGAVADKRDWTFFVYGHGDHNLSNSLIRDLAEMASAELNDSVHVVVLADFDATQTIAGSDENFPTGSHLFRVTGGGAETELLETGAEFNFDDPAVLQAAVTQAFTRFPSEHRALVLWDHGGSWRGGFGGDTQDGKATSITPMSAATVAEAVRQGLLDAEIEAPLELFSFDTCLMAGAEVVSEFQDLAEVFISNAEIDYGDGWDYQAFLSYLAAHPEATPSELAALEVEVWDAQHLKASSNDKLLRSHVALDLPKFGAFVDSYGDFVTGWLNSAVESGVELGRASYFSLPAYMNQLENPGDNPELRDVGQLLLRIAAEASDAALVARAKAASKALDAAILGRSQGTIREAAGQRGVHIELPLANVMTQELLTAYASLAPTFSQTTGWDQALLAYGSLNDGLAPTITASVENAETPDAANLPTVLFSVPDGDLAEAQLELGAVLDPSAPDEVLFYGVTAKGAIESNTEYAVPWDGQLTALPDGQGGLQAVYVRIWEDVGSDVGTGEATAPLLASFGVITGADGQEVLGALLFQDGDTEAGLLALFDPALTLPLGEVASDLPGTTFTPVLISVSLSTLTETPVLGTTIALDAASVPIERGPASAGAYALMTSVTDVFGNAGVDLQVVSIVDPIVIP